MIGLLYRWPYLAGNFFLWLHGVPPKSQKVTVLVLSRLLRSHVDLNLIGLLYCGTSLAGDFILWINEII